MNIDTKTGLVHEWTVLCRSSAIDKDTGSLSLLDIVDRLVVNKDQFEKHIDKQEKEGVESEKRGFVVPADFEIFTMWSKSNRDTISLEIKTEISDAQGIPLFRFSYNIFMKEGRKKSRNRSKIKGFKITGEGLYIVTLSLRKDEGEEFRPITRTGIDIILKSFDETKKEKTPK